MHSAWPNKKRNILWFMNNWENSVIVFVFTLNVQNQRNVHVKKSRTFHACVAYVLNVHVTSVEKTTFDTAKFSVCCSHESCSNYETVRKIYGRKKGKQIVTSNNNNSNRDTSSSSTHTHIAYNTVTTAKLI